MIGRAVSHYTILKKLGAGGMGEVYLAHDTKLGRNVALKFLPTDVASDGDRMRRFVQEARSASALNHPNIAHIYEIGEADGLNFIVMEYVDGETLSSRISNGPLDNDQLVEIALQIANALDESHSKGVAHRDIKPTNIMFTSNGQIKVVDFGLAKVTKHLDPAQTSETATVTATQPGMVVGTLPYMSPEQALGKKVNHSSDIFSSGIVFYEMATGRRPFVGKNAAELIEKILHSQAEAIARFNYNVPQELERIIRKCMEKDPERRYQSAHDLSIDLKNLQRDIQPSATLAQGPLTSPARTKLSLLIAVLLALAVVAASLITYYSLQNRPNTIRSIAVLPFENESKDAEIEYLSDGITESVINNLSQLPNLRVIARSSVFRYKGKQFNPDTVARELKVQGIVTGEVGQRGNIVSVRTELMDVQQNRQLWGEQYNLKMSDIFLIQQDITNRITDKLKLKLTDPIQKSIGKQYTENPEAYQLYLLGRYHWNKRKIESFKKALEYFQQAIDKDPGYAPAYAALSETYLAMQYSPGGLAPKEALIRAKAAAEKAIEMDDKLADAHNALASVNWDTWNWSSVENHFKRAIELNPNYATAHHWYAEYLATMGRFQEALVEIRRAAELDPFSLAINDDVGKIFYWSRQYDRAIDHFRKTLELDPGFAQSRKGLAFAYRQKGLYSEAVKEYLKNESLSGASSEKVAKLQQTYDRFGWRKFLEELAELNKERSKSVYISSYGIAQIYADLGQKEEAFEWLNKTYHAHDNWLAYLNVDPHWDPIRSDPRFAELIKKVGLPPIRQ